MRLIDADYFKGQIAAITIKNDINASKGIALMELVDAQPTAYDTEKKLVCNCTGCKYDKTDECMHCMRAYSDCYESINKNKDLEKYNGTHKNYTIRGIAKRS